MSLIESRVCNLEKTVAEHDVKLETACTSLNKVADKLDDVCEKLSTLVGAEASKTKFVDMMIGAVITIFAGVILHEIC